MKRGQNMSSTQRQNRSLILRSVLQHPGISRAQLAELTGLTPAAITNISRTLIKARWIEETGASSDQVTVGRPSIGMKVTHDHHYIGAVHLQRHLIRVGLVELDGTIRENSKRELPLPPEPEKILATIIEMMEDIMGQVRLPHVLGIGVGASGLVDYGTGLIKVSYRYGWTKVPLGMRLAEALELPVVIDNNARGMALAESLMGPHQDARWLVFLYVGQGSAIGVWADGQMYRGSSGIGGEMGHVTVMMGGEPCWCGNRGCLEVYLGENEVRRKLGINEDEPLAPALNKVSSNYRAYFEELVSTAIVNAINAYNPDVVVLGGWVDQAWPILKDGVERSLSGRMKYWPRAAKVAQSSFGSDIGLIGAAAIGLGQLVYGVGDEDWDVRPIRADPGKAFVQPL